MLIRNVVLAGMMVGAVAAVGVAAGLQEESAGRAERGRVLLENVRFSEPRKIDNPYLPLGTLKRDVLEGTEGGRKVRIERTVKPELRKTFQIAGQRVEALAVEDREMEGGELSEVTVDYFAQDDNGTVYYLGEEVDEYKGGKVVGHGGAWMLGKETSVPGVILPGKPKVGAKFRSEDVSAEIMEEDEVVSVSERVKVPAGEYADCIKVRESVAGEKPEYKYYAKGVGVVREVPAEGDVGLVSHEVREGGKKQQNGANGNAGAKAGAGGAEPIVPEKVARVALDYVGADAEAEEVWMTAINDPALSADARQNLIEDLNENGISNPDHPTADDLPLIESRLALIEEVGPEAMDDVNAAAFKEAYKDLVNMEAKLVR